MVETAVNLRSFIVSPTPPLKSKLPLIHCADKILELHDNNKVSISIGSNIRWMDARSHLSKFLDQNFTQIQKIEILKKIFHGIHTQERTEALRFMKLLNKKKK
jgi:hypothetical protein